MVALLEKLNDIGAGLVAFNLALVLENGKARNGKIDLWLELVGLEVSPKKSIKFLSHAYFSL